MSVESSRPPSAACASITSSKRPLTTDWGSVAPAEYGPCSGEYDGLELRCRAWSMQALAVEHVESSYLADPGRFPPGSAEFDCALLMQGIAHEWHGRPSIRSPVRACLATSGAQ